jgi:hypothetical protein
LRIRKIKMRITLFKRPRVKNKGSSTSSSFLLLLIYRAQSLIAA